MIKIFTILTVLVMLSGCTTVYPKEWSECEKICEQNKGISYYDAFYNTCSCKNGLSKQN